MPKRREPDHEPTLQPAQLATAGPPSSPAPPTTDNIALLTIEATDFCVSLTALDGVQRHDAWIYQVVGRLVKRLVARPMLLERRRARLELARSVTAEHHAQRALDRAEQQRLAAQRALDRADAQLAPVVHRMERARQDGVWTETEPVDA